jgi:putative transposase
MRTARIKIPAEAGEAVYHCISRTVNGERLFDETAREVLRKQLWQVADFCGVNILTYALLSNHFHVLIRVPKLQPIDDTELLRRFRVLYPRPTRYQSAQLSVLEAQLKEDGPEARLWRRRQLALMNDVSQFMKLLKQRCTIWFNQTHRRFGTLWAERFKSVLIEPRGNVIQTIAAYIDLNPVRAGLVRDPKEYRFCGYAEAVAGAERARAGLRSVVGGNWSQAQAAYRQILYGTGAAPRSERGTLSAEDFRRVVAEGGRLPLATVLRCRLRYFTHGAVLGTKAYVAAHLARTRPALPRSTRHGPLPSLLPAITDWGELATLRRPHRRSVWD